MKRTVTYVVMCWLCAGALTASANSNIEFYVATDGNDSNPGTLQKPFANIEAARDAIRKLKQAGPLEKPVTVWIGSGTYYREQCFELTKEDSGTKETPIVYRAHGKERVHVVGGKEIPASSFKPVVDGAILERLDEAARSKVLQADLKALGISDYGEPITGRLEPQFFCDEMLMTLARWPNSGFLPHIRVPEDNGEFVYKGNRPERWLKAVDAKARGYWTAEYYNGDLWIGQIDADNKIIKFTSSEGSPERIRRSNSPWYAYNLLEEIDIPGEWYLDRRRGIFYFWPPDDFPNSRVLVSMLKEPMAALRDTCHVTFRSLTLEVSRYNAMIVEGGSHNLIAGCTIRNVGGEGISLTGTNNGIVGCDIYNIGASTIRLSGGDRRSLTPANLYAVNNHIHHYGTLQDSRRSVEIIRGVGNRVAHNLIHDGSQGAINYNGNDHIIEFNEIHDVVLHAGDAAAIYKDGRDWTERGNVIRYNFVHHIPHYKGRAVMLDDIHSSTKIFGNVFYKIGQPVILGGGRDNILENNIFIECDQPVRMDNRGLIWESLHPSGPIYKKMEQQAELFTKPPWSTRYPKLARILRENPRAPFGNTLERNVYYRSGWCDPEEDCRRRLEGQIDEPYLKITDNYVTDEAPGFVDAANMNFQLRDDSIVYQKIRGFKKIPFDKIGPYQDEYRASWPVGGKRQ